MTNSKDNLTDKVKDNSFKGWFSSNKDNLSKIGIYSANFFSDLFSNLYGASTAIGNAYGAIGFGTLDIILRKQKSLRESKFNRLVVKTGGSFYFIGACVYDAVSALKGNYGNNLAQLVFDASMAYQLDRDSDLLYEKLNSKTKKDKKLGPKDDLKGLFEDIKDKFAGKLEDNVSGKDNSKNFKEHLSNFGKIALTSVSYGLSSGYGFGKGAFEKLKENYSKRETITRRAKRIKKIRKDRLVQENRRFSDSEKVSLKKKKEILEYCGKNPVFMRGYEIENEYSKFKQKPIKEQIQIITNEKNHLKEDFKQMRTASWITRFRKSGSISDTKKSLKQIEEILRKLDIEEKNPPRAQAMKAYLTKKEGEEKDGKQNS